MTDSPGSPRSFTFDGTVVPFQAGQTAAAALWASGRRSWRTTRVQAAPRGVFCGIGACYDCLATVDGSPGERLCITPARPGAVITSSAVPAAAPLSGRARRRELASGADVTACTPGVSKVPFLTYDLVVIGGGPAGLAAAATAALGGTTVALLDTAPRLGGQFWRHREGETGAHGYRQWPVFAGLSSIVEERVDHVPGATVWFAARSDRYFELQTSVGVYRAPRIVLATGAHDRILPFPGWHLPGVVTPGAAQALLKGSGVPVGRRVVVAGAGPFLLPVAVGLAEAGVRVVGVFEAGDPSPYLSRPSVLAGALGKLGEAAGYAARLARYRVPYRVRHAAIAARAGADGSVSHVDVARLDPAGDVVPGTRRRLACDALAVGYGFTANIELALMVGCRTVVATDGGLKVLVDDDGQTTVPGVYAAGEITGVGGSALAVVEGELAGHAAGSGTALSARERTNAVRRRDRLRAFAEVMHAAHPAPAGWPAWLEPDTLVCRCEEVPHASLVDAVAELGATDARSVKLLARPGMGWCQGRTCGAAVAALTARAGGRVVTRDDLLALAHRPLATPVRLADLAGLDDDEG